VLYYESHVTMEPVTGFRFEAVKTVAAKHGFRIAKLLMRKDEEHRDDAFMTARSQDLQDINTRTVALVQELQKLKFTVRRYKIELTITDSKEVDAWKLLK
jgi:uncharacterized protein involved in exopolysaccharide biosynthesis